MKKIISSEMKVFTPAIPRLSARWIAQVWRTIHCRNETPSAAIAGSELSESLDRDRSYNTVLY